MPVRPSPPRLPVQKESKDQRDAAKETKDRKKTSKGGHWDSEEAVRKDSTGNTALPNHNNGSDSRNGRNNKK